MRFLKTKYYPVCLDTKKIFNDPHQRERDLAWKYKGQQPCIIGLKGKRLNEHDCYKKFEVIKPAQEGK